MSNQVSPCPSGTLRAILERGEFVLAPGVFEMLGAKIADRMDFPALYMTGYGVSTSHLGQPDAGIAGFTDMQGRARTIAHGVSKPLIADADTGFGGLINIRHTVRGYEEAGVQAIQLEDQESPKKCGHTPNRRVVALPDAVRRIEVAVDSRRSRDLPTPGAPVTSTARAAISSRQLARLISRSCSSCSRPTNGVERPSSRRVSSLRTRSRSSTYPTPST